MSNKPARTIPEQIQLLKDRGMTFRNEENAAITLLNITVQPTPLKLNLR